MVKTIKFLRQTSCMNLIKTKSKETTYTTYTMILSIYYSNFCQNAFITYFLIQISSITEINILLLSFQSILLRFIINKLSFKIFSINYGD